VKQRTLRAALTTAVLVGIGLPASAQSTPWEDRVFVNLSFGVDTGSTDISQNRSFVVYNETGTLQADVEYGSFPIFDLAVGARVFRNVGVAIGFHTGSTKGDGQLVASVPHPQFFDRHRMVTAPFDDADRDERATHLQIGWMMPVNDRFDLFIYGGPSFFQVTQEVVTDLSFTEQGPPYTNITILPNIQRQKENATGYNFGVDGTYFILTSDSWRLGIGGLLRFTGATADFSSGDATVETDLGGVQFAVGARIRF
jgi:hypothetical protein